jgi:histidinol-phosphate aminotransferase
MGLLDYYRQFEGMSEEEVNKGLRAEADERKRKALTRVETLDLSHTTWPELPHPRIVNAITFVARRGMHRYPHLSGSDLRNALAERHGVDPRRLILGNGAAELLSAATRALIGPGQQLLTPWPSYPLYPLMARRGHGVATRVPDGGVDALLEAARDPDVRVIAIASPNDPTGELLEMGELQRLLENLPEGIGVLLDEALVDFADAQPTSSSLALLEHHPRLLVFRTFSKAWGLAGLRIGYAIGGPGSEDLLAELEPDLGVSEVSQAGALEALRTCSELIDLRVRSIWVERPRVIAALREHGFEVSDSQANFVWAAHPVHDGAEIATRLGRSGVLVAAGDALGAPRHVRIALQSTAASDRLIDALEKALHDSPAPAAPSAPSQPTAEFD